MTQQQPPPASGLAGVLSIVQAVVSLVPRWLVVAVGLVFVAWLGFEMYVNAQMLLIKKEQAAAEMSKSINDAKITQQKTSVDTFSRSEDENHQILCNSKNAETRRLYCPDGH